MIKAIFFDLGNVIVNFSYERMCQKLAEACGLDPIQIHQYLLANDLGVLYETGGISTQDFCNSLRKFARIPCTNEDILDALTENFYPNETIFPVIQELKAKGLPLFLLSNTCEVHFDYIKKNYPISREFDRAILSYEVGARKPDKAIFEAALAAAKCPPEQCFYTDDILDYVNAAKLLKIDSELFEGTPILLEHLKSRNLLE